MRAQLVHIDIDICNYQKEPLAATGYKNERSPDHVARTSRHLAARTGQKLVELSFEVITITRSSASDGPKIIFVNEAFTRLTGYAASDIVRCVARF